VSQQPVATRGSFNQTIPGSGLVAERAFAALWSILLSSDGPLSAMILDVSPQFG
jgi:hypothetical protein